MTQSAPATAPSPEKASKMPWALIGALWVGEMASAFESAMILAAIKDLVAEFGDAAKVGWLITGFLIVATVSAALVGRLGDIYGRRRCLILVLLIAALGSLISAVAPNYEILLFGRLLQGATGAVLPLSIGLVRENAPPDKIPATIGLMISGASVGSALGLVVGGLIVDYLSWPAIFYASICFCLMAAAATFLAIPRSPQHRPTEMIDWISGIAFAPGVALLLIYSGNGGKYGWTNPLMLLGLGLGIALIIWWLRQSLTSANPLISVRSFQDRRIAITALVSALAALGTMQILVVFSLLMQAPTWTGIGLGLTATMAGLMKMPSNLSSVFAGPLAGWITGRGGGRTALASGALIASLGWILAYFNSSTAWIVGAELVIISFGTAMLFAVAPTIIAQTAPPDRVSEVTGLIGVIRGMFMGIGAQIVTIILASDSVRQGGESYPSTAAFHTAILVIIALSLLAALIAFTLPRSAAPER
jgi:MFS family permease